MRILHYIPSLDRAAGGTSTYMQLLAQGLSALVELHIATHASEHPVEMPGAQVHWLPARAGGLKAAYNSMRKLRREWLALLSELRPDVVHVNCCWLPECAAVQRWAQGAGYRVVLTPHGMLEPWIMQRHYWTRKLPALLLYQRRAVKQADLLHATAPQERDHLLRLGWNTRICTIPNAVDVSHIRMKDSWQPKKEFLFLSRVHIKKGIDHLIEAVAQLNAPTAPPVPPDWGGDRRTAVVNAPLIGEGYTLRIVGEGEASYVAELKAMAERLGIGEMVRFEGGVYGERKWELMRRADIFVLPTHSENFGIVVAEALASGTPVITTTGTPWTELPRRGCGWRVPVGTAPLAEALSETLALGATELQAMGERGRRLIEERYSVEAVAEQMAEAYKKVKSDFLT